MPQGTLTVHITDIRNQHGEIRLGFFTDQQSFSDEKPRYIKILSKKSMQAGSLTFVTDDIPKGRYGIALLDDENRNGVMDYRFLLPVEGFGFSGYYHKGLRKPSFERFAFNWDGTQKRVTIRVRYVN